MHSRRSGVGLQDWPQHQRFELPEVRAASALDLVLREQMLYVCDAAAGSLGLFKLKEAVIWHGTLFKLRKGSITAMAVDYITLNVFWSARDQPGVYVTSADGAHTALIVDKGMVHSVTLHPPTGRLCFSNSELQGTGTGLECTSMDGGNHTVVWDRAINPVSLSLSNDGTRLYWVDTSECTRQVCIRKHVKGVHHLRVALLSCILLDNRTFQTLCKLIFCVRAAGLGLINSVKTDGTEHKVLRSEEPVIAFTLASNVLVWLTKTGTRAFMSILLIELEM